jgi:Transposase DDE domain.
MHATHVLDRHLRTHCQETHERRMDAVISMVNALLRGRVLTVTGLGRSLRGSTAPKHQIKKADRLIGNPHLHSERNVFYRALISITLGKTRRPVILVDWSDVSDDRAFQKLRAAAAVEGRVLTLYEEVHPQSKSANRRVQNRFFKTLQRLLPEQCQPIIVTDAGFKNPWFNAVQALGWDFIGRVGGHIMLRDPDTETAWTRVEHIFATATTSARYHGEIELARANPLRCHAYTLKRKPTGRFKKTRFGTKCAMKHRLKNADRERTPWLLVTSLPGGQAISKAVIRLYRARMQIEEAFRDLKNHRYGFSFRDCMSRQPHRLENLLLIGALATLAAWMVGKVAELKGLHRQFQANTIRTRNVLSTFYLGCEVISSAWIKMTSTDYRDALRVLRVDRFANALAA